MEPPVEGALLLEGLLQKRRCSKMSSLVVKFLSYYWRCHPLVYRLSVDITYLSDSCRENHGISAGLC